MEEDAQRALKEIKDYDGKKISLSVAKKKIRDNKKTGVCKSISKINYESFHAMFT